jgi:type II restriction enzyme
MKRSFDDIIKSLKKTVADYTYYTDFQKVYKNVDKYKIELNILNSLIGEAQIEEKFKELIEYYPNVLKVVPILLAKRGYQVEVFTDKNITFDFFEKNMNIEMYSEFMKKSGLFDLLKTSKIKSLTDYLTGIEVGLDSNARKNRTGTAMENIVESYIKKIPNIEYHKEMMKKTISEEYNIDINYLIKGDDIQKEAEKRFDFVVKTKNDLFLIETNFYSGGGSKLNETARSFKSIANDINKIDNVHFVWITDGIGWISARNNLKETYDIMEHLYTLKDLENDILEDLFK